MTKQTETSWEVTFDEKVKELHNQRPELYRESKPVAFGYSIDRDTEVFRIVDFGNIKNFISTELQKAREEGKKEQMMSEGSNGWIKDIRIQAYEELESKLPEVVNTLEELQKLNKNLPSTIAEQSYYESKGWIQCLSEVKQIIENLKNI